MLRALCSSIRLARSSSLQPACFSRLLSSSSGVLAGTDSHEAQSSEEQLGGMHKQVKLNDMPTPTVFDRLVTINVVDLNGKRRSVRGVAGMTLAQVLIEANYPKTLSSMLLHYLMPCVQSYFFPNMGFYTQHIVDAHVFVPQDYWSKIPNYKDGSDEADAIKRTFREIVQDCVKSTSYLASYIVLTPEFNNMTIGIGPIKPWILHSEWAFNGVHDDPTPQFKEPTSEIWG